MLHRRAVRAVIRRGDLLLMMHSSIAGDFKFPGGGVEPGESPHQAIVREVREECGRTVTEVGAVVLRAIERRRAREPGLIFQMESIYYACGVADEVHAQRLDAYEQDLAFEPAWVSLDEAVDVNQTILAQGMAQTWLTRETQVLLALRDQS